MAAPYLNRGITMTFASSGFSMNLLDVSPPGGQVESFETTHQGTTTAKTFTPDDLIEWTNGTLTVQYDPADDPGAFVGQEETITWNLPGSSTWSHTGWIESFQPTGTLGQLMTATCEIKVDGDITVT